MKLHILAIVFFICNSREDLQDDIVNMQRFIDSLPGRVSLRNYRLLTTGTGILKEAYSHSYFETTELNITFPNSPTSEYDVVMVGLLPFDKCPANSQFVYYHKMNMTGDDNATGNQTVPYTPPVSDMVAVLVFRQNDTVNPYLINEYLTGKITAQTCVNIMAYMANRTAIAGTYFNVTADK